MRYVLIILQPTEPWTMLLNVPKQQT